MTTVDTSGAEVATRPARLSDDELAGIQSFEDAIALLKSSGLAPATITDFGNGFEVLEDKRQLLKVPFLILSWAFNNGDHGDFVTMYVVTDNGRKLVVNDGSTGIREQLVSISEKRLTEFGGDITKAHSGLYCPKGLRISEYVYVNDKGDKSNAATFYLAN